LQKAKKGGPRYRKQQRTKRARNLIKRFLSSLSTESSSELEILGLDGDSLGVDGWRRGEEEEESASRKKRRKAREKREERRTSQVGILEEGDEVSLRSLLESHDGAVREKRKGRRDG